MALPRTYARLDQALAKRGGAPSPGLVNEVRALADRLGFRIGGTPLSEVPNASGERTLLAKWESENEFGSVKDRVALALVADALASGSIDQHRGFVEYTGGSLGVSLAAIASALHVPATLVMSEATAPSIVQACRAAGATVELVGPNPGFADVMVHALDLAERTGEHFLFQHANPACREIHARWTGQELVHDLDGRRCSALVAPIGTGGTLVGCTIALRSAGSSTLAVGVTPAELPYGSAEAPNALPKLAGSGGLGHCMRQPFVVQLDGPASVESVVSYSEALAGMARFHAATGRWIGSSAAAAWLVASRLSLDSRSKERTLVIFPSAGTPEEQQRAAAHDLADARRGH